MLKRMLVVEPDSRVRAQLRTAARGLADLDACATLPEARAQLLEASYDWLITNVRLDAYNGLHLLYLVLSTKIPVRTLVYSSHPEDVILAREAQRAGAFYEPQHAIGRALRAYLQADLPECDRRDPGVRDRRAGFRGGRRSADYPQQVVSLPM